MVRQDCAIRQAEYECTTSAAARHGTATRMPAALVAAIVAGLALALSTSARAATITVDSLADTGAPGICVLRDAITAADTKTATNGCIAGTGNDTINFGLTGTIALASTLPQVTDSLLTINGPASPGITIDGGGAVQVMHVATGATVNLNDLTVAHGSAQSGGGIDNEGTLTVTGSTFSANSANGGSFPTGGGIENSGGTLTVANSTFSSNSAVGGGGINSGGTLTVSNSTFVGNSAGFGGGVYVSGSGEITNSTFSANSAAAFEGGAIYNGAHPLTVSNCTFSGNSADVGGAIANFEFLTIINSTFADNSSSPGFGGAIFSYGVRIRIKSTILAASSAGGNCHGHFLDHGYNISDDASCEFSASGSLNNTNPQLDPAGLSNNGGPTQTIALLADSLAIDTIPLADCTDLASPPNPIITDQRLFPRPDGGETNCDVGAYEVQDSAFVPFSQFRGRLKIDPDAGIFHLNGGFKLGSGASIDPTSQSVAFSVGSYAIRLPAGSFVTDSGGYVYHKKINRIFLGIFIKMTSTPGRYILLVYRNGGTLTSTTSLVPVTLTIGNNSGSTQMNAKFD